LAVARAWEAHVDNRFFEVGIAEALYVKFDVHASTLERKE
jgi:hypothetical protein